MQTRRGFTILEMGIVLVIIALITGAVFAGKSMITNAEMRTITTEQNMYATAFSEFIDKYQAIAGDMTNATDVWGTDPGGCPAATNTIHKVTTCNGDGNGTVGTWTNGAAATEAEWFRAWQHLSNAGLIKGKFTGVQAAASSTTTNIGVNVPLSTSSKGGWTLMWMKSTTDNNFFFSTYPVASHTLIYGAQTANSFTDTGILAPTDAKSIDTKADDGLPHTGDIRSKRVDATTCGVSSDTTSGYNVTSTSQTCQLMFLLGQ